MNQLVTQGIVLSRINYGEADRIVTLLTPDHGKLRLMARGVRKPKSRLAGGIELFSISDITYIRGKGEIGTLVSSRLITHYEHIVTDIDRTMLGYELIKQVAKATEDAPEAAYFSLVQDIFSALNDHSISTDLIRVWCMAQLLYLAGLEPNLQTDNEGNVLQADQQYNFDIDSMSLVRAEQGRFDAGKIKYLRLLLSAHKPKVLQQVTGGDRLAVELTPLIKTLYSAHSHA